ncbi:pyridoxamine 5'-phosphate oxidase family protein [Bradyrhizobium sp. 200]|nr:pyridoxamine 5'-phosphate oxidase family protein [Bradyrhizobium sp. 200]
MAPPFWPRRWQEGHVRFRRNTGGLLPKASARLIDGIAIMSQVKTVEQLRAVLPEPRETTKAKILPFLDEQAIDFLRTCPFGLMATAGRDGPIEVSPKGDEPGFVHVENERTVLLPERAGNNLAFRLQNILETGRIGMIFLRPRTGETLRLSGRAEIFDDAELLAALGMSGRPALPSGSTLSGAISTARVRCSDRTSGNRSTGRKPSASRSERFLRPGPAAARIRRRKSTPLSRRDTRPICGRMVDLRCTD